MSIEIKAETWGHQEETYIILHIYNPQKYVLFIYMTPNIGQGQFKVQDQTDWLRATKRKLRVTGTILFTLNFHLLTDHNARLIYIVMPFGVEIDTNYFNSPLTYWQ